MADKNDKLNMECILTRDKWLRKGNLLITTDYVIDETLTLIRTRIGHFDVEASLDDNDLENMSELEKHAHSLSDALKHLPSIELSAEQTRRLGNGTAPRLAAALPPPGSLVRLVKPDGRLGAIGEVGSGGDIQIRRNFRYPPARG